MLIRIAKTFLFIVFFIVLACRDKNSGTATITIHSHPLTTTSPSFSIKFCHQLFCSRCRKIYGYTDRMIDPLLNATLHPNLHHPIYIVCCCLVIWRFSNQLIQLLLRKILLRIVTIFTHPKHKLVMKNNVFLKRIAILIDIINTNIYIVWIYFSASLINGHKCRFNTRSSLRHDTCCSSWSNSQTSNVAAPVLFHILVKLRISIFQTKNEWIIFLKFRIENCKSTTFLCHLHR